MWVEVLIVAVLTLANAALSGSEMALVSLRDTQIRRLEGTGPRGQRLARLTADPTRFLSTIQVGITLSGFLASATAAVSLAQPLVEPLGFLGGAAEGAAVACVTIVLSYVTLVVGELAPKRIAMQRSEEWALAAARPVTALARVSGPAIWFLSRSTNAIVRLVGADPDRVRETVTDEEILDLIAAQESISPEQREIMTGAFAVDERRLWQVLVPRTRVLFLRSDAPASDSLHRLVGAGHTRAPVLSVEGPEIASDAAAVVGVAHLRDLVNVDASTGAVAREALLLPDSVKVLDALRRFREHRSQMALVIDEFGSVAGIVTLEDLLEEIVGEIYDEFDPDQVHATWNEDGSIVLPGSFPAHDLGDLDVDVDAGDSATLAGIVLEALGHLPEVGERVERDGWVLEVLAVRGRLIERVRLRRP